MNKIYKIICICLLALLAGCTRQIANEEPQEDKNDNPVISSEDSPVESAPVENGPDGDEDCPVPADSEGFFEDNPKGYPLDNIDDKFVIEDKRDDKIDITGKYVYPEDPEFYFEIHDDYAILCENFMDYNRFTGACISKALEISYFENETEIVFRCKREEEGSCSSTAMVYYSEEEGVFTWAFLHDPKLSSEFIRQP